MSGMLKMTEQQLEEYRADLEYDNFRADGYRMIHEKRLAEEMEQKALHPETNNWGQIVDELTKRHL